MSSDEEIEEERERQPADIKIYVDSCTGYIGSAVSDALVKLGYDVYTYGECKNSKVKKLGSRKEGILSTELSVFEMIETTEAFADALEIVNGNPLHKKYKMACFTPILTWGGRSFAKEGEEEEEHAKPPEHEEEEEQEKIEEEKPKEEEDEEEKEPETPINEEEYLARRPHELVKEQYILESRALQLNYENDRLDIYLFAVGLLYGFGESLLFPFFRSLWEFKEDMFPASKAHISCMHVANLVFCVTQLFNLEEEDQRHYFVISEANCPTLKSIAKAFSGILSDGKVIEIQPTINELHYAILTTELAAESNFIQEVEDLHCAEGIIECAAKVVDEFRAKYHLEPFKVLVIGPPASGFEFVAQKIADHLALPFLEPYQILSEVRAQNSEFADEIKENIEENEGKITDEIVVKVTHRKMFSRQCRNKGWSIAGFADNAERAGLLFNDQEDEEVASPHFAHIPTHVIVLDATDDQLRRKAAEKTSDSATFERNLRRYRKGEKPSEEPVEDENQDIFSFYDDRAIPSLITPAFNNDLKEVYEFLGPKRDFGRPLEEIEAEIQERLRKEEEIRQKIEQERQAVLEEQGKQWDEGAKIFEITVQRLEKEEADFLASCSKVLEDGLDITVVPHLIEGLIEIAKTKPENPIDQLAAFLFKRHRELKKK